MSMYPRLKWNFKSIPFLIFLSLASTTFAGQSGLLFSVSEALSILTINTTIPSHSYPTLRHSAFNTTTVELSTLPL